MDQNIRWVKASDRGPSYYDADSNGKVLIRYSVNGSWSFHLCDYHRVHVESEWAEGLIDNKLGWRLLAR